MALSLYICIGISFPHRTSKYLQSQLFSCSSALWNKLIEACAEHRKHLLKTWVSLNFFFSCKNKTSNQKSNKMKQINWSLLSDTFNPSTSPYWSWKEKHGLVQGHIFYFDQRHSSFSRAVWEVGVTTDNCWLVLGVQSRSCMMLQVAAQRPWILDFQWQTVIAMRDFREY